MSLPVGLLSLVTVSACGPQPVEESAGFEQSPGDTRVFTAFGRTATTTRGTIRLRAGDRHVLIRMDCVLGDGEHTRSGHHDDTATVRVWGGGAVSNCEEESNARGGIGLTRPHALRRSMSVPIVVRVPSHTTWSLVVDAGPDETDTTGG